MVVLLLSISILGLLEVTLMALATLIERPKYDIYIVWCTLLVQTRMSLASN